MLSYLATKVKDGIVVDDKDLVVCDFCLQFSTLKAIKPKKDFKVTIHAPGLGTNANALGKAVNNT